MRKLPIEIMKINALVIEHPEDENKVDIIKDKSKFEEILNSELQPWQINKVFELTGDTSNKILEIIVNNSKLDKDNLKMSTELKKSNIFVDILPLITDMDINLELPEDKEYIEFMLSLNKPIINSIVGVASDLILNIMDELVRNIKKTNSLPKNIKQLIEEKNKVEQLEEAVLVKKQEILQKEIDEEFNKFENIQNED